MKIGIAEAFSILAFIVSAIVIPVIGYYVKQIDRAIATLRADVDANRKEAEVSSFECSKRHSQKIKEVEDRMHSIENDNRSRFEEVKDLINQNNVELRESNHTLRDSMQAIFSEIKVALATMTSKISQLEAYNAKRP